MGPFTLLLVDNDAELLHLLQQRLVHDGFQIITAESGRQALLALDHCLPDLDLVNLLLSDVDSLQLVEQIRRRSDVPVIFLTSIHGVRVRAQDVQRCAEDYVVKPFEYEELLDRIRRVLDRPGGTTNRKSAMDTEVRLTERQLRVTCWPKLAQADCIRQVEAGQELGQGAAGHGWQATRSAHSGLQRADSALAGTRL
jgi:DNA-binding response OmpR family regulator